MNKLLLQYAHVEHQNMMAMILYGSNHRGDELAIGFE
jgi:hypothetical protein